MSQSQDQQVHMFYFSQPADRWISKERVAFHNQVNFVTVLLETVLAEQPALGWGKIGDVYFDDASFFSRENSSRFDTFDIVGQTITLGSLNLGGFRKFNQFFKELKSNVLRIIGGPVPEEFAEAALLQTEADLFFSGSALGSFRRFCEHFAECKSKNVHLDLEFLRNIPGLYIRNGNKVIKPFSSEQPTDFIQKLELKFESLLRYLNESPYLSEKPRLLPAYPMFSPCRQKCSFCAQNPIGVPLTHKQRHRYFEALSARLNDMRRRFSFEPVGPNFDFTDVGYLRQQKKNNSTFSVMCKVSALLHPGRIGQRKPKENLVRSLVESGMVKLELGVESNYLSQRTAFGKPPFTNSELDAIISSTSRIHREVGGAESMFILLDMLPSTVSTGFIQMLNESVHLYDLHMKFRTKKEYPIIVAISVDAPSFVTPFPETPEHEILRFFHEQFQSAFEDYFDSEFGHYIFSPPGKNGGEPLYGVSLPFDPIARAVASANSWILEKLIKDFSFTYAESRQNAIFLEYYLTVLSIQAYLQYAVDYPDKLPGNYPYLSKRLISDIEAGVSIFEAESLLRENCSRRDDIPFLEVKRLHEEHLKERGMKELEFALAKTPLRDPKVYELYRQIGRIRREMTQERKRGNPNWAKVQIK